MGVEKFVRNPLLRRELWSIESDNESLIDVGQMGEAVAQAGAGEDQVVEVVAHFAGRLQPTIHGAGLSTGRRARARAMCCAIASPGKWIYKPSVDCITPE